jgi:hypothetical protein
VDPHHFANLDPHPDPHPLEIQIRIRIKICKLDPGPDPDPHQFADFKPKCMEYGPILAYFQGFEPFLEAGMWIRIRIRVKSRIRIHIEICKKKCLQQSMLGGPEPKNLAKILSYISELFK